jgi:hypothetical protein
VGVYGWCCGSEDRSRRVPLLLGGGWFSPSRSSPPQTPVVAARPRSSLLTLPVFGLRLNACVHLIRPRERSFALPKAPPTRGFSDRGAEI